MQGNIEINGKKYSNEVIFSTDTTACQQKPQQQPQQLPPREFDPLSREGASKAGE